MQMPLTTVPHLSKMNGANSYSWLFESFMKIDASISELTT
jgi:hypothetical protein